MDRWTPGAGTRKVALVRIPTSRWRLYRWYWLLASRQPPLGLLYIASHLRQHGVDAVLLDGEKLGAAGLRSRLESFRPDVIGVTVTTFAFWDVAAFLREMRARFPHALLIVGGPHPTALPAETLAQVPELDAVVVGEGEEPMLRVAVGDAPGGVAGLAWRDAEEDVHLSPSAPFREDLDRTKLRWEMLDGFPHAYQPNLQSRRPGGTVALVASRGCLYSCVYCASGNLYGSKHRAHSPEYLARVMEAMEEQFGVRDFYFHDDYFTMRPEWLEEFCRVMVARGSRFSWSCASRLEKLEDALLQRMGRAGCYQIGVGVESGSARMLRVMHKGTTPERLEEGLKRIAANGIEVKAYIIIGTREESLRDLWQTMGLLRRARVRHVQVLYFTPLPGSPSYRQYPAPPSSWPRMNLLNRMEGAALPTWALRTIELALYATVYGPRLLRLGRAPSPARAATRAGS